jgi:hypothetical protein
MCFALLCTPNNIAEAYKSKGIEDNSIKFLAYEYPYDIKQSVIEFKFVDQGDGTAKLKPYYNGKFVSINEIPEKLALYGDFLFNLSNIYGLDVGQFLNRGNSVRSVAEYMNTLTFTYGVDAFRVIKLPAVNPFDFDYEGLFTNSIGGEIKGNLGKTSFEQVLSSSEGSLEWRFRVREDGVYAEYENQDKLPDGEYIIEMPNSSNRVLDVLSGDNVGSNNYVSSSNTQKVYLEYDKVNAAYRIKSSRGKYATWDKANGYDVRWSNKMSGEDVGQQCWYLKKLDSGYYNIISSRHSDRYLNLDSNNTNISVSNNKNNRHKQQFKFIEVYDKEDTLSGNIEIVSKLDNNKVVNVHLGSSTGKDITLWDDSDVNQQRFKFEYDEYKKAYKIRDNYYNGYLSCDNNVNSDKVYISNQCQTASYWQLEDAGDGYYFIKNIHNGKYLDVHSSKTHNGNTVCIWKKGGSNNQKFKLVQVDGKAEQFNGKFEIVSKLDNNKVLNIHLGSSTGKELTLWDDANVNQQRFTFEYNKYKKAYTIKDNHHGAYLMSDTNIKDRVAVSHNLGDNSYWILEDAGDGYYFIKNAHTGLYLDITNSSTHNGNTVIGHAKHGGNNQQFKLVQQ